MTSLKIIQLATDKDVPTEPPYSFRHTFPEVEKPKWNLAF
jgi:hypothetical protein